MSRPKTRELPSREELLNILYYYDGKLYWKIDRKMNRWSYKADEELFGYSDNNGYRKILINGVRYLRSRIIYQIVHGNLTTDLMIDHINRKVSDDRIENLRAVSQKYNNRNRDIQSNNSTGYNGVYFRVKTVRNMAGDTKEYGSYVATWRDLHGISRSKSFSTEKYGKDVAFKLSCEYRADMLKTLVSSGEWYDDSHGVAAMNTNRKFIGVEMDEGYFQIAKKRIEEASKYAGEQP